MKEQYMWDEFEVDETLAKLAAREFADPKHGMPEWAKNSSDAYIRTHVSKGQRPILLFYFSGSSSGKGQAFACLDLVGMKTDDLLKLRRWGSPTAAGHGPGIAGGHGNGGKSFATSGFKGPTFYYTCKDGVGNIYGFPEPPRPKPAWASDKSKDFPVKNSLAFLKESLSLIGIDITKLSKPLKTYIDGINGFTLVIGQDPKDVSRKFIDRWMGHLKGHKEMVIPLTMCEVYAIVDGKVLNQGQPLVLDPITPMAGYESPLIEEVPQNLVDPETGKEISTVEGGLPQGELTLQTVEKRISQFHRMDYLQGDRIIGTKPIRDLVGQGYWTDAIYGRCSLPALTEEYVGNLRGPLVDRPLTRALDSWIGSVIMSWAKEMEKKSLKDKALEVTEQRKKMLIEQIKVMNQLKDKLLEEALSFVGSEEEGGGGRLKKKPREMLPDLPVQEIRVASGGEVAGVLVEVPFTVVFYGKDGTEVQPVPIEWHSTNTSVARVNPDRQVIATDHEGSTEIWCHSLEGVTSNKVSLRVVDCSQIELSPLEIQVAIGRRVKITATGILATGEQIPDIRLFWRSSDEDIAVVGQHGIVTGIARGQAMITAMEGDATSKTIEVKVTPLEGGRKGSGKPQFLLSEIQTPWYLDEPRKATPDHNLVYQEGEDVEYNVWWINLRSPMADYIINRYGESSEIWLVYLAERFADGLIQAKLTSGPERGSQLAQVDVVLSETDYTRKEFIKRFIGEFHKAGQLVILD